MTAPATDRAFVPAILGTNIPLIGNPYSLTKAAYTNVVKPLATPTLPYVTPYLAGALNLALPVTTPLLAAVGLSTFKPLPTDAKGNSTVDVRPELSVQTIIGGKASADQEFDVFVARIVETCKDLKVPDRFGGGKKAE